MVLNNASINWNMISAMSNITLSILTLTALLITLYTVFLTNFPRGKIHFHLENVTPYNKYRIRLTNKRNVPITVIHRGFYVKKDGGKPLLIGDSSRVKLEWSDLDYYSNYQNVIDQKLFDFGFTAGQDVEIYGFFKTGTNRIYKTKIKHKIQSQGMEFTIQSNA